MYELPNILCHILNFKFAITDMPLYGLCPAQEFYLVVCEMCGHLVKPQALQHHMGK